MPKWKEQMKNRLANGTFGHNEPMDQDGHNDDPFDEPMDQDEHLNEPEPHW